jgi:hypothetical protein
LRAEHGGVFVCQHDKVVTLDIAEGEDNIWKGSVGGLIIVEEKDYSIHFQPSR